MDHTIHHPAKQRKIGLNEARMEKEKAAFDLEHNKNKAYAKDNHKQLGRDYPRKVVVIINQEVKFSEYLDPVGICKDQVNEFLGKYYHGPWNGKPYYIHTCAPLATEDLKAKQAHFKYRERVCRTVQVNSPQHKPLEYDLTAGNIRTKRLLEEKSLDHQYINADDQRKYRNRRKNKRKNRK